MTDQPLEAVCSNRISMFEMSGVNNDYLKDLYLRMKLSIPQIADILSLPRSRVRDLLLNVGVELRSRADGIRLRRFACGSAMRGKIRKLSKSHIEKIRTHRVQWAEENAVGISLKPSGYFEYTRGANKGRRVHDVLFEDSIGRKLLPHEVVHHLDGDRGNNDPTNLVLMTRAEHSRLHRIEEHQAGKIRERDINGRFR